ncbi:fucosyl transferase [Trichuris suis]|nr:fucosyl transferase [Trichuris suis]
MCPNVPCEITNERKEFNVGKAVLFHPRDINPIDMPAKRLSHMHYIFFLLESPHHVNLFLTAKNFFTLTMTYRKDSDIYMPYGWVRKMEKPMNESSWAKFLIETALKKHRLVAAFVSNCQPPSAREDYVRALQQYIKVDVYGTCGPLKCPKSESEKCLDMLRREYKFFLAFENSVCKDYATEKLFNSLKYNVVPIVLSRRIAEPLLPNGSFIAADDFATVKELAVYLRQLDHDMEKYLKYFDWMKSHEVIGYSDMKSLAFCRLCKVLMEAPLGEVGRSKSAKNIVKWYLLEGKCLRNYGTRIIGNPVTRNPPAKKRFNLNGKGKLRVGKFPRNRLNKEIRH